MEGHITLVRYCPQPTSRPRPWWGVGNEMSAVASGVYMWVYCVHEGARDSDSLLWYDFDAVLV